MRRRDVLTGLSGAGILGAAGILHVRGVPFGSNVGDEPAHEPKTLAGVEAPGSEGTPQTIPAVGQPTFLVFFATTCTVCIAEMPELAAASDRFPDVKFISVTAETRDYVSDEELASWWNEHGGSWQLARDDGYELVRYYSRATPTAALFDADGRLHWEETGKKSADEIATLIEHLP